MVNNAAGNEQLITLADDTPNASSAVVDESLVVNSAEIKAAMLQDLDWFASVALPEVVDLAFPDMYKIFWHLLISALQSGKNDETFEKFFRFALGLPRGHAKTTLIKLLVLFGILFTNRQYFLVLGANSTKAEAIISDVCDMLDSYNIQEIFGNWRYSGEVLRADLKKFVFNGRPVILEAAGYGTSIRGANQKNARPDVIIFDDCQTKECAMSLTEAKKFAAWFYGTALKAKSQRGCVIIYVGNMYPDLELSTDANAPGSAPKIYCCMLRNLQLSAQWKSLIVGALLESGNTLWPELVSVDDLIAEYLIDKSAGQVDTFNAEVLNDPTPNTSLLVDTNKITCFRNEDGFQHQGNFIVIDPATSKNTPDQVVIGYFEVYDAVPVAIELLVGKFSSPDTVQRTLALAMRRECPLILVESNAYQYALCDWFQFFIQQMSLTGVQVVDFYTQKQKIGKILAWFKLLVDQKFYTSPDTHNMILAQILSFNPRIKDNVDDILDICAIASQAAVKYRHMLHITGEFTVEARVQQLLAHQKAGNADETPCPF